MQKNNKIYLVSALPVSIILIALVAVNISSVVDSSKTNVLYFCRGFDLEDKSLFFTIKHDQKNDTLTLKKGLIRKKKFFLNEDSCKSLQIAYSVDTKYLEYELTCPENDIISQKIIIELAGKYPPYTIYSKSFIDKPLVGDCQKIEQTNLYR